MKQFDIVRLRLDLPASGLKAGTRGVILDVEQHPPGSEVEWFDAEGEHIDSLGMAPDLIERETETR